MKAQAVSPLNRLAHKLRLARLALAWERLWPALWPTTAIALGFAAVSVWGAFELLPGWLHLALLVLFSGGLAFSAWRGLRRLRWPSQRDIRRRIELDSGAPHRPLETLTDTFGQPTSANSLALWRAHQEWALRLAHRLRVGWPRAGLAVRDPRGFRVALTLVVFVGFVSAGADWQQRFAFAVTPNLRSDATISAKLTAWISPPSYTAVPPIFLTPPLGQEAEAFLASTELRETIRVPTGAKFLARIHGGHGVPELLGAEKMPMTFTVVDSENYQMTVPLEAVTNLNVIQGRSTLAAWKIKMVPDRAPEIAHTHTIVITQHMALQIQYAAADDYGLASVRLRVRRLDSGAEEAFDIPLPDVRPRAAQGARFFDLTPHPWAGLPVALILEAEDEIGQTGQAEQVRMHLPEREFNNPIARAILEQRRKLVIDPTQRNPVREALDVIADLNAEDIGDYGIYLSLRSSISRLTHDLSKTAIPEVVDQLWTTALALEEGDMGVAERALRDAQQALQDALTRNAPDDEIEQLVEELRAAMHEYMQALAERTLQNPAEPGQQYGQPPTMSAQDLMDMLDRAADLTRLGARESAQQMLSKLQQIMENLRTANPRNNQGIADQTLQELNEIMQQQQQLMDQTFRQEQRGLFGDPAQLPQAGEQQSLGQRLQETMEGLGRTISQVPSELDDAAQAMENAARALQEGQAGPALQQQTDALNQLRQGAARIVEQMMGQMIGEVGGDPRNAAFGEQREPTFDPLGRPMTGLGADVSNRIKVPDSGNLQRVHEILEELFRRASERNRPILELNYLERLLRRF